VTNKGTVSDKHSSGLSLVKHLVTSRHIVSFKVTSFKLLRDTGNKQAHCMHIVRFTLVTRMPLDESNQGEP